MRHKLLAIAAVAFIVSTLAVAPAEAQRRGGHHRGGGRGRIAVIHHSPLLFGGGFYSGFYNPYYFGFGQWYPPFYGYPPGIYHDNAVSVRLQIAPREALVYVDGYAAGMVDDYDGVFQRLRLIPGPHEIVVYHAGHRTLRQSVYYNPGSSHTIRHTLEPLGAGEVQEPQPVPRQMPVAGPGAGPGAPAPGDPRGADSDRVGTLSLRVQPEGATVMVDGEVWKGPQSQNRLVIQLSEGPHSIRVERAGFQTFSVDVDVRAGETTSFNVSLLSR